MTPSRLILAAALGAALAHSASVKSWDISDYASFLPGTLEAVSMYDGGLLRLAPQVVDLHDSEDAVAWTSAVAPDGTVYLGTGHGGRLYRVPAGEDGELMWTAPEIEIFALAVGPDGDVFAGTSPSGKVYKVSADGEAEVFFDPEQEYIWDLRFADDGALYVATGPSGDIYRVSPNGEGELWFDTEQRHVTALAFDAEDRLLAAADPSGLLYRIDGKDSAFALYDSTLPEIRDIQVASDGSIYLAAMGGAISLSDNMVQSVSTAAATTIRVTATASGGGAAPGAQPAATSVPAATATAAPTVAPAPAVNYGIETAALLVLRPGERAETLWTSTQENILAMSLVEDDAGVRALLATDQMGRLYEVSADGSSVLLAQTNEQQITSLAASDRGVVMTSAYGSPTRLLTGERAEDGRYETAPFDATAIARWGHADIRSSGEVRVETRSGNTARPDKTWSDWEPVEGKVASPPARYLQWAAVFDSADDVLDTVRISYLTANAKPQINSVTVSAAPAASASTASTTASAATASPYTITVTADGSTSGSASASDSTTPKANGSSGLRITWQAFDLDGDDLTARVEFRGEGETAWKLLKKDITDSHTTVDGEALADGRYRFRVTVSDAADNPGDTAREDDRISSLTLIDHTPPVVDAEIAGDTARFTATDRASRIVEAHYSVDGGEWLPVHSRDGLTDDLAEAFDVPLSDMASGEHLITLRVRDEAGNAGLAKAVVSR